MPDYSTLDAETAAGYVSAPPDLDRRRKLVGAPTVADRDAQPEHWQGGYGVTAPMPDATDPNSAPYRRALEAAFVVEDCASDVWERKRRGVLGKAPHESVEPDRDEDGQPDASADATAEAADPLAAEAAAVEQALRSWEARQANGLGAVSVLRDWLGGMALAGRSYLRLRVPRGLLTDVETTTVGEGGEPVVTRSRFARVSSAEDALRMIYAEHMYADQSALHVDRDTMEPVGVSVFAADGTAPTNASDRRVEMVYLGGAPGEDRRETVIRSLGGNTAKSFAASAGGEADEEVRLDLGGRLTLFEGTMRPTVSPSVVSNQRDLNTYRTMASINSHKAGFPSLVFLGAEPPTAVVNGQEVEVDYQDGPGKTGFFAASPRTDELGQPTGAGSASVTRFGPVDNATLRADAAVAREAIYRGAKQFHVLALSGANLSGEAMIQGQGEFVADLVEACVVVNAGGRWMLETAWRLACALAGTPERARAVRAVFACRPDAGPLSAALRAQILAQQAAGLLSRETAMSLLGVDDLDAERERIAQEAVEASEARAVEGAALFGTLPAIGGAAGGDGQAGTEPSAGIGGVTAGDLDPATNA